jgi:type I thyroxine 5'-deiodinase
VIYIAEAHPSDGWQMASNESDGVLIRQAVTFDERVSAATRCAAELGLTIPMLLDGMNDAAMRAFAGWPERIFIFDGGGRAYYCGGPGPFEFKPDEARAALEKLTSAGGGRPVTIREGTET